MQLQWIDRKSHAWAKGIEHNYVIYKNHKGYCVNIHWEKAVDRKREVQFVSDSLLDAISFCNDHNQRSE